LPLNGKKVLPQTATYFPLKAVLYRSCFKILDFSKISARDLTFTKQAPIQEIGAMERGVKIGMLMQGKENFETRAV